MSKEETTIGVSPDAIDKQLDEIEEKLSPLASLSSAEVAEHSQLVAQLGRGVIKVMEQAASIAKEAGKEGALAMQVCVNLSSAIEELCKQDNLTPETTEKLAEISLEAIKEVRKMNKENKTFWEKHSSMVGWFALGVILTTIAAVFFPKEKSNPLA